MFNVAWSFDGGNDVHDTLHVFQGIGLFMEELESAGYLNNTLVLYTSDNGIPYPNAKTNLYESGMGEPMMISNPFQQQHWGEVRETTILHSSPFYIKILNRTC